MYLGTDDSHTYYDSDGTQRHMQGDFLLLLAPEDETSLSNNLRACVRQVALEQFGHYMMGTARIGGESFTVSGAYGSNGLPMDVPRKIWKEYGTPVPDDLYEQWRTGGGHNSAGAEGPDLRDWAKKHIDALTP